MDQNPLSEFQFKRLANDLAAYIQDQRQKYLDRARPLSSIDKKELLKFFPPQILNMARFLKLENEKIVNPPFLLEVNNQGFSYPDLNTMDAVTFHDVVVVIKDLIPKVKFHELVHVLQYQKLGIGGFANKYSSGLLSGGDYRNIPIEEHAYQLGERYFNNPGQAFSVEKEVLNWIENGKY